MAATVSTHMMKLPNTKVGRSHLENRRRGSTIIHRRGWSTQMRLWSISAFGVFNWICMMLFRKGFEQQQQQAQSQNYPVSSGRSRPRQEAFPTTENRNGTTFKNQNQQHTRHLPPWMQDYIKWHHQQRALFPGTQILTHPQAPALLIRTCHELCGGLHDRLGMLPWDIYLAYKTQRLLLISWCYPAPLESFLLPNEIDWSIPMLPNLPPKLDNRQRCKVGRLTNLFDGLREESDTRTTKAETSYNIQPHQDWLLDRAIDRAGINGTWSSKRRLRHRIYANDIHWMQRIQQMTTHNQSSSYDDGLYNSSSFGHLFHAFFWPSPILQQAVQEVMTHNQLWPHQFTAVHVRARHPKAFTLTQPASPNRTTIDEKGLWWQGTMREAAIDMAQHAMNCVRAKLPKKHLPVFFYSDSDHLVHHMITTFAQNQTSNGERITGRHDAENTSSSHLRDQTLHIGYAGPGDKVTTAEEYLSTFVDFWIALQAHCHVFGVGNYGYLAYLVSGSQCAWRHQNEAFVPGAAHFLKTQQVPLCPP